MATNAELYVPTSPSKFNYRPLSVGMVTTETSMAMPDGSFLEVNGFDITTRGPKKHGGWEPALFVSGTTTPLQFVPMDVTERIEEITQLTMANGTSIELLLSNRALYIMDDVTGFTRLNWAQLYTVNSKSATATHTTVVSTGDFREHYIVDTDTIIINGIEYVMTAVNATATNLTITFLGIPTLSGVLTFNIFKPFAAREQQFVDFTVARYKMYLVDGLTQMIWKFDGAIAVDGKYYVVPHLVKGNAGERSVMGAKTVSFFGERLYFGGILEDELDPQQNHVYTSRMNRVRWTEVLNHALSYAANYQDLTRTYGDVVKIMGMGALIMVYMTDSLYYGRSTNLTSIPYVFTLIESAGTTALGMKAISTYFDGQVFLGTDNLYFISSSVQISPLGKNVSDTLKDCTGITYMSRVAIDAERSRIVVSTSNTLASHEFMFFFNYKSTGWSMNDSMQFVAPAHFANTVYLRYEDLPVNDTYETSLEAPKQYSALLSNDTTKDFYCFVDGYLLKYVETAGVNTFVVGGFPVEFPTETELITPDFDFNEPDTDKTALRISLKITEPNASARTEPIYLSVAGSRDRGSTWKNLGRMRIRPGYDEDAINFRLMGSTLRFRFRHGYSLETTATNVPPFTISELILRIRERSIEAQRSNARE